MHSTQDEALLPLYLACVYLACKVSDRVKYKGMLTAMIKFMLLVEVRPEEVCHQPFED